jgi:SAM-dependent methyltransferase
MNRTASTSLRALVRKWSQFYHSVGLSYHGKLRRACFGEFDSVLDLGSGSGARFCVTKQDRVIPFSVGLDINRKKIENCHSKRIYSCCVVADARKLPFKQRSVDVVLCLDLVEHLPKREGRRLIEEVVSVAKKQVIIHTPNGFMATPSEDSFEEHISAWNVDDFRSYGFRVFGDSGLKLPPKFKAVDLFEDLVSLRIRFLVALLDYVVGEALVHKAPRYAYQLFCTKEVRG